MIVLGLTGSIGMGKSTTAKFFREQGVAVFDADRCVHQLYGGRALDLVNSRFPAAIRDGAIQRDLLAKQVLDDPIALADLEEIIHPLVVAERTGFLQREKGRGSPLAVVDVPLLFETGGSESVDVIVVVSASPDEQRRRVLARPGMDEAKFLAVSRRQTPDAEKRRRCHFLIRSDRGLASARRQVGGIIAALHQADR